MLLFYFILRFYRTLHSSVAIRLSISSSPVSLVEKLPWGTEPTIELGLPYSKPTLYQLSYAAPSLSYTELSF